MIPNYDDPLDSIYVGVLPHRGGEDSLIEEFCFSLYLEGSLVFSRKELAIADRTESCRFAGKTFHEILKLKFVNPSSVDIFNRGRTSSDILSIIECKGLNERNLSSFLESLENPKSETLRRRSISEKSYDQGVEVCLGVLPHYSGKGINVREQCCSLYVGGKLAHAVKEIDMAEPKTAGLSYAGKRFRKMLEEKGVDLGKVTITNGRRTTSEGLRRVRCDEFSEMDVSYFGKAFNPSETEAA